MHQFVEEMCTILLQIDRTLWAIFMMHCGIREIDQLINDIIL